MPDFDQDFEETVSRFVRQVVALNLLYPRIRAEVALAPLQTIKDQKHRGVDFKRDSATIEPSELIHLNGEAFLMSCYSTTSHYAEKTALISLTAYAEDYLGTLLKFTALREPSHLRDISFGITLPQLNRIIEGEKKTGEEIRDQLLEDYLKAKKSANVTELLKSAWEATGTKYPNDSRFTKIKILVALRNSSVHGGGKVDSRFLQTIKSAGEDPGEMIIGSELPFSRYQVENFSEILLSVGVEVGIRLWSRSPNADKEKLFLMMLNIFSAIQNLEFGRERTIDLLNVLCSKPLIAKTSTRWALAVYVASLQVISREKTEDDVLTRAIRLLEDSSHPALAKLITSLVRADEWHLYRCALLSYLELGPNPDVGETLTPAYILSYAKRDTALSFVAKHQNLWSQVEFSVEKILLEDRATRH